MSTTPTVAVCSHCKKERNARSDVRGGVRLPQGWKREDGEPVCPECWHKKYILRSLIFPVAEPMSGSWRALETDLRQMWVQTTAAINWMMTQCYVRDVRRTDEQKMPPMPRIYLYPEARIRFPELPPQSLSALEHIVQRRYRARRYEVNWTASATLATARYPQPFPIHNGAWKTSFQGGVPIVECRIGASSWKLRLKSGFRHQRQIAGLQRMVQQADMAIYRAANGTILVKLVAWLTRTETKQREDVLLVRTGKDRLIEAGVKGEPFWVENRDDLPGIVAAHRNRLRRLNEDQKAEQRPVPSFGDIRSRAARQYRDRIKSLIQEVCSHLTRFALRRGYAKVLYDDSERWLDSFPYFQLAERLRVMLDEHGIEFEKIVPASGPGSTRQQNPPEEE